MSRDETFTTDGPVSVRDLAATLHYLRDHDMSHDESCPQCRNDATTAVVLLRIRHRAPGLKVAPRVVDLDEAEVVAGLQEDANADRELVREWDVTLPPLPDATYQWQGYRLVGPLPTTTEQAEERRAMWEARWEAEPESGKGLMLAALNPDPPSLGDRIDDLADRVDRLERTVGT